MLKPITAVIATSLAVLALAAESSSRPVNANDLAAIRGGATAPSCYLLDQPTCPAQVGGDCAGAGCSFNIDTMQQECTGAGLVRTSPNQPTWNKCISPQQQGRKSCTTQVFYCTTKKECAVPCVRQIFTNAWICDVTNTQQDSHDQGTLSTDACSSSG